MYINILFWILAFLLVIAGLVGLAFPALPGAPLLFAGLFVAAWIEDFLHVGSKTLIVLGIMTILTYGVDFLASAFGAKRFGASRREASCEASRTDHALALHRPPSFAAACLT